MSFIRRLIFNLWYFQSPPWDTGITPPELVEYINAHPPGRALDLGCGTGTNVIALAKAGWQVIGIDFAYRAILMGRKKARQAGVQVDLCAGDVMQLDALSGKFDLILDIGCFHSLSEHDRLAYIHNLDKLLAERGDFLMYAFFKQPGGADTGLLALDLDNLANRFKLVNRKDGIERGQRPSAWFTYRR